MYGMKKIQQKETIQSHHAKSYYTTRHQTAPESVCFLFHYICTKSCDSSRLVRSAPMQTISSVVWTKHDFTVKIQMNKQMRASDVYCVPIFRFVR